MTDMEKDKIIKDCMEKAMYNGCGVPTCLVVILFIVVMFFSSCATRTKIEYKDRDVYHYVTKVEKDTVMERVHDSVYIHERNDTVWFEKWHTKYIDKIVERHDTCWRDSLVTEYKETIKEVVKYPKTYWWFLGISIISIIFAFVKVSRWLRMIL